MTTIATTAGTPGKDTSKQVQDALAAANPNVLRMALYHATRDPELAAMTVQLFPFWGGAFQVGMLGEADAEIVRAKATAFLNDGAPDDLPAPAEKELREMMRLMTTVPPSDFVYDFTQGDLTEDEFPLGLEWHKEPPAATKQSFHTLVIGAGLAGLSTAIQLDRLGLPYTVLEQNAGVGGTWWLNDYPECRVDIASHHYQYSFMKNYPWKHYFATQPELRAYAQEVAAKFDLNRNIRFQTEVKDARWDEAAALWHVRVIGPDGKEAVLTANAVISAVGLFHEPNTPDIPGIETFRGKMFHSTQWDHDYDYDGQRVGQIGVGSTGAQLVPEVARRAAHLTIYQRSAQWVSEIPGYRDPVSEDVQWLFDNFPHYWGWHCYFTSATNIGDPEGLQNYDREWQKAGGVVSKRNDGIRQSNLEYIKAKVGHDPELMRKVTPDDAPFAKRPVVDNGWFDTLNRDNVELVTEPIARITPEGIVTSDGVEQKFDLILLCAGFKADRFLFPVNYVGRDGVSLEDAWRDDGARGYLGLTIAGFPNFFTIYGPNGQCRAGGLIKWLETWSRYALSSIVKLIESGHRSMEIKPDVFDAYNRRMDDALEECIWVSSKSYYVNDQGRQVVNMPWKPADYYQWIKEPNLDDFTLS